MFRNSVFYQGPVNMEEIKCGYMYKSPFQSLLFKSLKSWKRRYFVLTRNAANQYELKFYKDENKREKAIGQINLYQVILLYKETTSHPMWSWILKNFRCSESCVLYMKTSEREYFLVGENSSDMDDWFYTIFKVLNTPVTRLPDLEENRTRSISEPPNMLNEGQEWLNIQKQKKPDQNPSTTSGRYSAPSELSPQVSHYDYPRNYMMTAPQYTENEDTEEDEEDEVIMSKECETGAGSSCYMDMDSVKAILKQTQNEEELFPQTSLEGNKISRNSFLQPITEDSDTISNRHVSPGSETTVPVEKELCISHDELKNIIFSDKAGRLCITKLRNTRHSGLFHEGDQILAVNDLLTENLTELQTYLKRLSKNQLKLTILRQPGSQLLSGYSK